MPDLADIEARLRDTENEIAEHRGDSGRILSEMADLRKELRAVAAAVGKFAQVEEVVRIAQAAHKRIDEFVKEVSPVIFEHNKCQAGKAAETSSYNNLHSKYGELKTGLATIAEKVAAMHTEEKQVKGWLNTRVTKLVDLALPAVLITLIGIMFMRFSGLTVQSTSSQMDAAKLEQITATLERLSRNQSLQMVQPNRGPVMAAPAPAEVAP